MNILKELSNLIHLNGFTLFVNVRWICIIYVLVFIVLFLENAIIPACFLPGDSLLIFLGILVAKGILNFFITLGILTIAAGLGSWISYLQGKIFKRNKMMQYWLSKYSDKSYQKAKSMLNKHGLCALFFGRFIVFVRTILPTIAGLSGLNFLKFQLFNWLSSFFWVLMLVMVGVCVEHLGYVCNF